MNCNVFLSQPRAPFAVDSGSGVVRIQSILDFDEQQSYTLVIRATVTISI